MRKYLDRKTVFVPLFCRLFSLCVVSPLFQWVLCGNQHNHKVQEAPASKSQENALAEASSGASTYCSKVYCWQCISQFSGIFWSWSFFGEVAQEFRAHYSIISFSFWSQEPLFGATVHLSSRSAFFPEAFFTVSDLFLYYGPWLKLLQPLSLFSYSLVFVSTLSFDWHLHCFFQLITSTRFLCINVAVQYLWEIRMCCHIREEILCLYLVEKSMRLAGKYLVSFPPRPVTPRASEITQSIVMWVCAAKMCAMCRTQVLLNISLYCWRIIV